MKIPEIPIEGRGTVESAGHSGRPRIQREIEHGKVLEAIKPIELPGDSTDEENPDDEPTVIGAAAMAPIRIVIPQEPKKE